MSKSSKYILADGCSFTDANFVSDVHVGMEINWPSWPEIFGEFCGLDVVNQGKCGKGNDIITNSLTKTILKDHKNIEMVVVGWSEIWRFAVYNHYKLNPMVALSWPDKNHPELQESARNLFKYMHQKDLVDVHYTSEIPSLFQLHMQSWIDNMFQIQELCKLLDIKYIMAPVCGTFNLSRYAPADKTLNGNIEFTEAQWFIMFAHMESFFDLDAEHLIGHPYFKDVSGFKFPFILPKKYQISEKDQHPNAEGHEWIARKFYEHYTKIYS